MAVTPGRQRLGLGARLVEAAIQAARTQVADIIVVLGHPAFYPRFGFSADRAKRIAGPFSGEAFMVLELSQRILDQHPATITYPPAFGLDPTAITPHLE
jgi:putative acetyltransferase